MKLILIITFLVSHVALAQDSSSMVKEGNITLDCDTNVDGAVCPSKYATKARLLDDTAVREGSTDSSTNDGTK